MEGNRFIIKPGIRRSVVLHYFIVVFLTMLILQIIFSVFVRSYYYDTISNYLESHATNSMKYYKNYTSILADDNSERWLPELHSYFNIDNAEVQILDKEGKVLITSSNFPVLEKVQTSDFLAAANNANAKIERWIGKVPETGETVMSVSAPLIANGNVSYVLRMATSLEAANSKIMSIIMLSILISIAVLLIIFLISVGLADSIVKPINEITIVSAQMAKGKFQVRAKEGYKYELGDLARTLNYMAKEIVKSNQLKNDFISSISHELRTPLTGIKGWSETLLLGNMHQVDEETKLGLNIISKETDRLIGLVEELLDFSKLQQNRLQLNWQPLSLYNILQETLFQVRMKAEQKQISLTLNDDATNSESDEQLNGDANRLKQVFLNLVDNAIKFSPDKSRIEVRLRRTHTHYEVRIIDSGIGISKEHLTKVMDKFYQVNPEHGGTGLGLAITDEIVKVHGGEMSIISEQGKGTTVIVELPVDYVPPARVADEED
ncbi:HAMP domain-containing histidine kinase [Paenibacillus sp. SC116]|uniref:sensor histidine kinase n=1 Tax=Paenibacillus sp. SC116 TaxID=2968986 RepID=UPI00215AC9D9|nr:HAMP domain-containing sensor histidine kinase [Paenibacillus sp. SC116]MCR8842767.1 HAMP domain-containing histidine kinase [Paenibacillus sp. SC116]